MERLYWVSQSQLEAIRQLIVPRVSDWGAKWLTHDGRLNIGVDTDILKSVVDADVVVVVCNFVKGVVDENEWLPRSEPFEALIQKAADEFLDAICLVSVARQSSPLEYLTQVDRSPQMRCRVIIDCCGYSLSIAVPYQCFAQIFECDDLHEMSSRKEAIQQLHGEYLVTLPLGATTYAELALLQVGQVITFNESIETMFNLATPSGSSILKGYLGRNADANKAFQVASSK